MSIDSYQESTDGLNQDETGTLVERKRKLNDENFF